MAEKFVVALDQGTTSSRAVLIDRQGRIRGMTQHPFTQYFPRPGWVEHNPLEIMSSQLNAFTELLISRHVRTSQIDSIGITNQRETTIIWDKETGIPLSNAIVWQCRRTTSIIENLCKSEGIRQQIINKTGLIPDAYFSASKIKWLLENTPGAAEAAAAGRLAFGTVDSWLIWSLTNKKVHATDVTNASRTMLYDIHQGSWDPWLLELFEIPTSLLPEVRPSSGDFGVTAHPGLAAGIPIYGVAGDQQAALFGQCCFEAGQAKNTYGTGCFLLMHTGTQACKSKHQLITTIAASAPDTATSKNSLPATIALNTTASGSSPSAAAAATTSESSPSSAAAAGQSKTEYALEGSVFVAGALIQWLRDEMGLIQTAEETEALASSVPDTAGVYVVPAFTGLGAPYWDPHARGLISGITRGTQKAHLVRAALESLAYQVSDLVFAMEDDAGSRMTELNVDGGASANNFLMQFQSDIIQAPLVRPAIIESTALGAAFLAGLKSGFWKDTGELRELHSDARLFEPQMSTKTQQRLLSGWKDAVSRSRL